MRDPTNIRRCYRKCEAISIHRSLAGPDIENNPMFAVFRISIHRSLAGPDQRRYKRHQRDPISLHRSLAGPHNAVFVPSSAVAVFQSTGPLRDPTALNDGVYKKGEISIHRSLAGPDVGFPTVSAELIYFNPQVPCGTRQIPEMLCVQIFNFNPQVPCGTRRQLSLGLRGRGYFNPQVPCGTRRHR